MGLYMEVSILRRYISVHDFCFLKLGSIGFQRSIGIVFHSVRIYMTVYQAMKMGGSKLVSDTSLRVTMDSCRVFKFALRSRVTPPSLPPSQTHPSRRAGCPGPMHGGHQSVCQSWQGQGRRGEEDKHGRGRGLCGCQKAQEEDTM